MGTIIIMWSICIPDDSAEGAVTVKGLGKTFLFLRPFHAGLLFRGHLIDQGPPKELIRSIGRGGGVLCSFFAVFLIASLLFFRCHRKS